MQCHWSEVSVGSLGVGGRCGGGGAAPPPRVLLSFAGAIKCFASVSHWFAGAIKCFTSMSKSATPWTKLPVGARAEVIASHVSKVSYAISVELRNASSTHDIKPYEMLDEAYIRSHLSVLSCARPITCTFACTADVDMRHVRPCTLLHAEFFVKMRIHVCARAHSLSVRSTASRATRCCVSQRRALGRRACSRSHAQPRGRCGARS